MFRTILLLSAVGCAIEPVGPNEGRNEDLEGPVNQTWCGVTVEAVAADVAPAGFETTPNDALAATTGRFTGGFDGGTAAVDVVPIGDLLLARVETFDVGEVADATPWEGPCEDHYQVPLAWTVDAGDLLGFTAETRLLYFPHEDALDQLSDSDTAFVSAVVAGWEGTADPSWDDGVPFVLQLAGYWEDDTWRVDLSFLGEVEGEAEEMIAVFDATPDETP